MKRISNIKKTILVIFVFFMIGYYIYYKWSNYKEFEISIDTKESLLEEKEDGQDKNESIEINTEKQKNEENIIVHITGAVINPGVINLEKGARVIDAVNKAGGFTEEADSIKINLAYMLIDGVKIYIPYKSESQESNNREYITANTGDNAIMEESKMKNITNLIVNINNATQAELETLPGIGESIALKIISYREENGRFSKIEEIKNVSGIGESKFEKIKELISV